MRTRNSRARRRGDKRRRPQGGFLLVTLAQCALCAVMVAMAYFASSFFGMTQLKPVFSSLLTEETDAEAVFACVKELWQGAKEIPQTVFSQKIVLSSPMSQPVIGVLTSDYGFRNGPFSSKTEFHTGVDVAAPSGAPILAAYPGVVSEAGVSREYGNYVVLHHGNFSTRYCHCLRVLAGRGEFVDAGERIALVGSTGNSTGPHLHLELLMDGRAADFGAETARWVEL